MMANIEERLIELLNTASVESDSQKKVECLYQIKEIAVNHGLLNKFFQEILAFQNGREPNVKKFVLNFIETACKRDCTLCSRAILSLNLLLNDTSTDIIKRSVQAATLFYRSLVQWIVLSAGSSSERAKIAVGNGGENNNSSHTATVQGQPLSPKSQGQNLAPTDELSSISTQVSADIEKTWLMWLRLQSSICGMLDTTNNDGVRTQCIKFIETIVLLQTPNDKPSDAAYDLNLIDPRMASIKLSSEAIGSGIEGLPKGQFLFDEAHKLELVDNAKRRFEQLVAFHGTSHISSVNLMATMQSLVILAKQRYRLFMGRVIQAIDSLNNRLPPTLTESQVQSVKKFLKVQLSVILKHPYAMDRHQNQIIQLLYAVGAKQAEIHKIMSEYAHKYKTEPSQVLGTSNMNSNTQFDPQKRIKLEPGQTIKQQATAMSAQPAPVGKSKHLDLNKLTQELDEKEKRQIVVDSVRRILGDERSVYIPSAQLDIKKKVLSTLAYEFYNTECPKIIQDYIFADLKNRSEICCAIIRKQLDMAASKAAKKQLSLLDPESGPNQDLLKNYFDCYNSYEVRAMSLDQSDPNRGHILPKLYALKKEYYALLWPDQIQDDEPVTVIQ